MITFEHSLFIRRAQQEVFDFVSNPANDSQWRDSVEVVEWTSDEPHGVGSTLHQVDRFLGRQIDSTIEITSWDPPHQIGQRVVAGPVPFEMQLSLVSVDHGTQLNLVGQSEFSGVFKLAEGLMGKELEKIIGSELDNLRRLLESPSV